MMSRWFQPVHQPWKQRKKKLLIIMVWSMLFAFTSFASVIVLVGRLAGKVEVSPSAWHSVHATDMSQAVPEVPPARISKALPVMMDEPDVVVRVWREKQNRAEDVPLETYLIGVVAGEMPIDYPLEALKAQAIAARTFLFWQKEHPDGTLPQEAWVRDSIRDQVYLDDATLRQSWGEQYRAYLAKIERAVQETAGLVMTYEGKPILSSFFAVSNGQTADVEDVWGKALPYLRSRPSPWDKKAPTYEQTLTVSLDTFQNTFHVPLSAVKRPEISLSRAGYVKEVAFGETRISGQTVREKLNLPSTSFRWTIDNDRVIIKTYGHGHGVGMSQWGARMLAENGWLAQDILTYYYTGIEFSVLSDDLKDLKHTDKKWVQQKTRYGKNKV